METLLQIEDLEVDVEDRKILAGFNLTINKGFILDSTGPLIPSVPKRQSIGKYSGIFFKDID